jgi:hypothetical protein
MEGGVKVPSYLILVVFDLLNRVKLNLCKEELFNILCGDDVLVLATMMGQDLRIEAVQCVHQFSSLLQHIQDIVNLTL